MKLKKSLNESFGIGELPSSKLIKMKISLTELLNERDDAGTHLDRLADLVGNASSFMNVGKELKRAKYKYNFSTNMVPMYTIDADGHRFGILNKKYVDNGDREVGDIAIGLLEATQIKESSEMEILQNFSVEVSAAIKKNIKDIKRLSPKTQKELGRLIGDFKDGLDNLSE